MQRVLGLRNARNRYERATGNAKDAEGTKGLGIGFTLNVLDGTPFTSGGWSRGWGSFPSQLVYAAGWRPVLLALLMTYNLLRIPYDYRRYTTRADRTL
ncbi:hypothetical protein Cagg_3512 [Chloroflexus aggregans DSM 9485]|uniref:Uncharacterized protein n=1 Tax=Chloroflexus aggregans (strain MD-66 / DSM 9485) TaxID=326427 RepID=B8G9J8_CHLAD|nr:hypothetical protein Cagg_3512 [Chloroflexus aggregans DSM 9485]